MRKINALLSGLLAFGAVCSVGGAVSLNANANGEQAKVIDVYVIAGQSNAAGCAMTSSLDAARKKDVYTSGFEDIYFYGKVDADESLNANGPFNTFDKVVKFGQGFDDDRFGAEIGIADMIAKSGTENESIIVKYASGSLNITNHWCPPSQRGGESKGAWYDGCMDTVQTAVTHYADLGYTVNLKGTFWMQGEAESENGNGGVYETYLTSLINDMREDYSEMFGANAKDAPFVVGKVAPTYNLGVATQTSLVRAAQDKVAQTLENVYVAETERYIIVDPVTGNRAPGCVDNWHFNGNDMLALGTQVGNLILNNGEKKTVAMYLIAGQSNASGYSLVDQVSLSYRNEHAEGFKNVYYYGRADFQYYKNFNTVVNFGLGRSISQFGSEVGIAEKHTAAYPDQEAIIVKYAMGATYLVDTPNNTTSQHGNWCSPSMPHNLGELSGKMYKGFIDTIKEAVDYYYDCGYALDLKGTFWMQGEAEADGSYAENKGDYKSHLKALIHDLRNDYAEILDDQIAQSSPFVIGRICKTFAGGNAGVDAVRKIQQEVSEEMSGDRVYLIETEQYPMVNPETGGHRGPDFYHYEGNDMLNIGRDVGETMITVGKAHVRVRVEGYGEANVPEYVFLQANDTKTVTFTATKERYLLKSVFYDDVDVTAQLVHNTFTIPDTEGMHTLVARFEKEPKYQVSVEANEDMVTVSRDPFQGYHYEGEKVTIVVQANTGYKITSVKWNGSDVTLNGSGAFEITVAAGENKLRVEAVSDGTVMESSRPQKTDKDNQNSSNTSSESEGGCSSIVAVLPVGFTVLGLGIACLLRKKEN